MKVFLFLIFTINLGSVFAGQLINISAPPHHFKMDSEPGFFQEEESKLSFFYVRFATAENDLIHATPPLPGIGIGYRRLAGEGAVDISINGIGHAEKKKGQIFWTAPKTSYVHYLKPNEQSSLYLGGGLAWGGLDARDRHFVGLIPSVILGYEFLHKGAFLSFTEFCLSQPLVSLYHVGVFPGPIAELSVGVGF